ncbi:MAG: hypothetical protein H0V33_10340 [Acidimicrobiia bacterium]|jgi:hypothetical protein|nr:hypothetical protein [Acidimicrobiia bacterium]
MRIAGFTAEADLVGHRVRVRWSVLPDLPAGPADTVEPVAGEPELVVLAKALDHEYGELLDPNGIDDYVVYDSTAFPPAPGDPDLDVEEVRRDEVVDAEGRHLIDVVTVARKALAEVPVDSVNGQLPPDERPDGRIEVLRRTRTTTFGPDGRPIARREELLDIGGGAGLAPLVPRCYELRVEGRAPGALRAVATPTRAHRSGRQLYEMIPGVWRRHDVPSAGVTARTGRVGAIPESRTDAGPLRRFVDLFGLATDHLHTRAEGLADLHDIEGVDPRLLGHLAHLVGWELSADRPVPEQRHEIRYATTLYGMTGTKPGVQLWAKRLTGWDVDVVEFAENVIFSNDLGVDHGNIDSPTETGSRTVDTSDAALLVSMGTTTDRGDYTYDTGTGPDDRYSSHTIGIFPREVDAEDRASDVARKRDRLLAATDRYLPANLRAVVVMDDEPVRTDGDRLLGVSASTDDSEFR